MNSYMESTIAIHVNWSVCHVSEVRGEIRHEVTLVCIVPSKILCWRSVCNLHVSLNCSADHNIL